MKTWIIYTIIGSAAVAAGAGGGIIYKRVVLDPKQNIVGFNPDYCKPDAEALFKMVDKFESKEEAAEKMTPCDIVNYANEKYKTYQYSVSFCTGLANTVVKQDIRNAQIRNGNTYFEEAISKSSMVGVGKRMIQKGLEGTLKLYDAKSSGDISINGTTVHTNFKEEPQMLTPEEYKKLYGRTLPDMFIYCIHSMTVQKESIDQLENGDYQLTLELDPKLGGYQYRYQMQTISGLDELPVFEYIILTYLLDKNLDLKHLNAHEKYKATMLGISPEIENTLDYDYFPNKEMNIPQITEDFNYKALEDLRK